MLLDEQILKKREEVLLSSNLPPPFCSSFLDHSGTTFRNWLKLRKSRDQMCSIKYKKINLQWSFQCGMIEPQTITKVGERA